LRLDGFCLLDPAESRSTVLVGSSLSSSGHARLPDEGWAQIAPGRVDLAAELTVGNRHQMGLSGNHHLQIAHANRIVGQNESTQENAEAPSSFARGRFRLRSDKVLAVAPTARTFTDRPSALMRCSSVCKTRKRSKVSINSAFHG
jgi:hypothetical protein